MDLLNIQEIKVFVEMIPKNLWIVVVAMLLIGVAFKKNKRFKDEWIPWILIGISFLLVVLINAPAIFAGTWTEIVSSLAYSFVYAAIIGSLSVGSHQALYKQFIKVKTIPDDGKK